MWWNNLYSHEHGHDHLSIHPRWLLDHTLNHGHHKVLILKANPAIILFQTPTVSLQIGNRMSPPESRPTLSPEPNWQNHSQTRYSCRDPLEFFHWDTCKGKIPLCFHRLFGHCSNGHTFLLVLGIHWHLEKKLILVNCKSK